MHTHRSFLFDCRLKHFSYEFQTYSSYSIIFILGISIALNCHTWLLRRKVTAALEKSRLALESWRKLTLQPAKHECRSFDPQFAASVLQDVAGLCGKL
jgi:hypothetical protein